ncbi:hypothetical protein CHRY9393_03445 [Chryseobacterium fistulae]|uniref:Uncharacterized protein n=1 Tax=Chryseobacterium fistulae TaxID=2675058 RepID=A0A6N4XT95_9FLAO|nr:hypothetical protein CHRY9393_03445 [Chryseobacterium fistulae]
MTIVKTVAQIKSLIPSIGIACGSGARLLRISGRTIIKKRRISDICIQILVINTSRRNFFGKIEFIFFLCDKFYNSNIIKTRVGKFLFPFFYRVLIRTIFFVLGLEYYHSRERGLNGYE